MRGMRKKAIPLKMLVLVTSVLFYSSLLAQQLPERLGFFDIRSASISLNEEVFELDARLQLILSDEALNALSSAVPLTIELEVEVIRVRRFLPDDPAPLLTFMYELEYRPLSQRYIVRNLNSGNQDSFSTLYSALNNLGRIQALPIIDDAVLDLDSDYRLRLRARLSTRQYPAALRFLFFWRSQWQLESEWYEWMLER